MSKLHCLSLCLVCAAACGTDMTYGALNRPSRPLRARPPDSVDVYADRLPGRPYLEIGLIEARQSSAFSTDQLRDVLSNMRKLAAGQGCDAIVVVGASDEVRDSVALQGLSAVCAVYEPRAAGCPSTSDPPGVDEDPAL